MKAIISTAVHRMQSHVYSSPKDNKLLDSFFAFFLAGGLSFSPDFFFPSTSFDLVTSFESSSEAAVSCLRFGTARAPRLTFVCDDEEVVVGSLDLEEDGVDADSGVKPSGSSGDNWGRPFTARMVITTGIGHVDHARNPMY